MGATRRWALTLCLLGTACAPPEPVREIRFWGMGREGEVVRDLMPEFERRHPGVRVRVQQLPWSAAHEKLLTAFVGGALPDVFQLGNTWVPEWAAIRAIAPLDAYLDEPGSERRDDLFPGILATNVLDETTWALPWYVDTRLLFYRRDLLDKAGVPPKSWSQWLAVLQRRQERQPTGFAILAPLSEWQPLVILALQAGSPLLDDRAEHGRFQEKEFRRAFSFYVDLFRTGLAPRAGEAQLANLYQEFGSGRIGSFVSGPWNLGELSRRLPAASQADWGVAPMPGADRSYPGVSVAGGSSLAIAATAAEPDLAWELIAYLGEPEQQLALHRMTGDLPASRRAWRDGRLSAEPRQRAFWEQLQHVVSTPKIPEWERIAAKIVLHTEAAVRGDRSIDEALADLDADVERILEKRRSLAATRGGTR